MQASTIKAAISRKTLAGALFVVLATVAFALTTTTEVEGRGSGCEGDVKIEGSKADYVAPPGKSIDYVCIKAGRNVFTFYCGETDKSGCYSLKWTVDSDGCCSAVSISGGGTGRDCKEISHTAVTFADGDCKKDPPPK
jgi:hypothetical protein